jgi:hypothetical protein
LFDANSKLLKLLNEKFENMQRKMKGVLYKDGIRYVMYALVATRADIAFAVSTVKHFKLKAGLPH